MTQRIGYVVAASLKERTEEVASRNPRPEYAVFVERNDATLLDYALLETTRSRAARSLARKGRRHFALPFAILPRQGEFDAFLASGEDVGLPLAVLMRLQGVGKPLFIITHGSYFGSRKFGKLLALVRGMRNVHYLCLSDSLRQTLVTRFGIPADNAYDPAYGVDTCFFSPQSLPPNSARPIVASAGTATRDYKTLVQATGGMEADIRIAADSAWFPTAVDIGTDALPVNVEARSYGDYVGLRSLYAASSFVVVPLYPAEHACGYAVIAEAMAMGKAVIATRTAAPPDFIEEGETGFYVPPGDPDALRNRIRFLMDNPETARSMGERARERFAERFSVEAYCAKMERIMGIDR